MYTTAGAVADTVACTEDDKLRIGVDIGGTGLRAASVHDDDLLEQRRCTNTDRTVDGVLDALADLLDGLPPGDVGIAVPGFVAHGRVVASPNFPTWHDVPFAARAAERLDRRVVIANDADCAALGASRALRAPDLLAVTLGTGVGGGRIVDGNLGPGRAATELGHVWVGGEARCGCGATGCLETIVGAPAVHRRAEALGLAGPPSSWSVDHPVWHPFQEALARGLQTATALLGPRAIALLGGMAGPATAAAITRFRAVALPIHRDVPVHVLGRADPYAIRGAAALVATIKV